jgi:hypothetical protein
MDWAHTEESAAQQVYSVVSRWIAFASDRMVCIHLCDDQTAAFDAEMRRKIGHLKDLRIDSPKEEVHHASLIKNG